MGKIIIASGYDEEDDGQKKEETQTFATEVEGEPLTLKKLDEIFAEFDQNHKSGYHLVKTVGGKVEIMSISQILGDQIWGNMRTLWKMSRMIVKEENEESGGGSDK